MDRQGIASLSATKGSNNGRMKRVVECGKKGRWQRAGVRAQRGEGGRLKAQSNKDDGRLRIEAEAKKSVASNL